MCKESESEYTYIYLIVNNSFVLNLHNTTVNLLV